MFKFILPIGYQINMKQVDGVVWRLEYLEILPTDTPERAFDNTTDLFAKLIPQFKAAGVDMSITLSKRNRTFEIQATGNRDAMIAMMAAEFMGVSTFGSMTLTDLLMVVACAMVKIPLPGTNNGGDGNQENVVHDPDKV